MNLFLSQTFWKFFFTAMRLKNKECVCFSVFWYIFNSTVGLHVLFSRYRYFIPRTTGKPYETSPDEFVSRPVRAIALCIPTVHHFRRKMHAHLRERKTPWGRGKEDGVGGWGLTGHAHRYVLILPLFFGVEASLEDHSSSRRFTFDRRECLVEPPAL